jgi:two-component sensor histidine kinase
VDVFAGRQISLKQGLLVVVLLALLPITFASIVQSLANWNAMQQPALYALEANANAIAERERDVFVVSNRLLRAAAANPEIRNITSRCNAALSAGFRGYQPLINFVRTDAAGRPRCSILPFDRRIDFTGEAWWERTKGAREITVNQPTIGTVSKVPVIIVAMPLYNADGSFDGTISSGIEIAKLVESVENAPEASRGSIVVVFRNGDTVARSGNGLPFQILTPIAAGSGIAKTGDGDWMYSVVPVSGQTLFAVYAQPRTQMLSAAQAQFRASIIIPLIAIILTLAAIWFGTNRLVVRWLTALRRWSNDFKKGDHSDNRPAFARAPIELKELSDDLHDMALKIDGRTTELTEALAAKTELAREVHHRIKNNLQIVTSLLMMQAARTTDAGALRALRQTRARIVALALIHRLSYEQQGTNERSEIAAGQLIDELSRQLRQIHREYQGIELKWHSDVLALSMDEALPFALFIVEATTNAYRHAFVGKSEGTIVVNLKVSGHMARLSIDDNGSGCGTGSSGKSELGIELMGGFASQLHGHFTLENGVEGGCSVILEFKVPDKAE